MCNVCQEVMSYLDSEYESDWIMYPDRIKPTIEKLVEENLDLKEELDKLKQTIKELDELIAEIRRIHDG